MNHIKIKNAYRYCKALASNHYENFPVASWLLPTRLRNPVAAVYAFARTADDIADEGNIDAQERYRLLTKMDQQLVDIKTGKVPDTPVFIALADTIHHFSIPYQLFHDLLIAFRMDIEKKTYSDFKEILFYCRHSANPVGRSLLYLFNQATDHNLLLSDNICTSLQLINFLQDIQQDLQENQRVYIPQNDMKQYGISEEILLQRAKDCNLDQLIELQISRAWLLLKDGAPLAWKLKGRIKFEIRLIAYGGLTILRKLYRQGNDKFSRPRLTVTDKLWMLYRAFFGNINDFNLPNLLHHPG
ncbi:MAG: squalene synthase HpnC [Gammaproteobacteria bacterium]